MGLQQSEEGPQGAAEFLGTNMWCGLYDGSWYSVNAGQDGTTHPDTGEVWLLRAGTNRFVLVSTNDRPGTGPMTITGADGRYVAIKDAHGKAYRLDLKTGKLG